MPSFEAKGLGRETNRRTERVYRAHDETEARQMAEADGMTLESIEMLPDEPATEAQLSYARDLEISVPENATKDELRDLLSCHLDHDKPATERHKSFARAYRVYHTRFVGKRVLFNMIFAALQSPGRERELVAWFTYRVYRHLVRGAEDAPVSGPDDSTVQAIASELVTDKSVLDSIKRYVGGDLIWFGEWTAPDHTTHTGGSNHTIAYKRASRLLCDKLNLQTRGARAQPNPSSAGAGNVVNTIRPNYRYAIYLILVGLVLLLLLVITYAV